MNQPRPRLAAKRMDFLQGKSWAGDISANTQPAPQALNQGGFTDP